MRKPILTPIFLLILLSTILQKQSFSQEKCPTQLIFDRLTESDKNNFLKAEKLSKSFENSFQNNFSKSNSPILTIPVVVHVVHSPLMPGSNLSEATIQSQIEAINEDFRRANEDRKNTRPIFSSIGADIQIEFVLAKRDPEGLPTNGITRTESALNYNPLVVEDFVKRSTTGGHDAWPADKYLNIWTCDMSLIASQFVIGYAQFPGGDPTTDGIVVQWQYFGRTSPENMSVGSKGRTATHEIGHWLGLRHIWGDGSCANDFVEDTPQADGSSSGCDLVKNTCSNESAFWGSVNPPDMVENYMDYSGDACMNLFTEGQKMRMLSFLYTDTLRKSLFTSDKGQDITSLHELNSGQLEVYPNPANGTINFSLKGENPSEIRIYNLVGQKILSAKFEPQLDISQVPSGSYLLQLTWENGQTTSKRLVVQQGN